MGEKIARIYEDLKIILTIKGEIYSYNDENKVDRMLPVMKKKNLEFYVKENKSFIFVKTDGFSKIIENKKEGVGEFENGSGGKVWRRVLENR